MTEHLKTMASDKEVAEGHQKTVRWLPVLMYHRVVDSIAQPDPYHVCISAADFEAQMAYLSGRGFQAIHLGEVPLAASDRSPWKKPVAITFDDGYLDTYTHAYPILNKYGLTATVMLVSDHIGGKNSWDYGKAESTRLASMDEIREMERGGIRFGSHGASHTSLTEMSLQQAQRELVDSKAKLEDMLGHEVPTLAYPFGRSTRDICKIAQKAGYVAACGIEQRAHTLFNLSRVDAAACKGNSVVWRLKVAGVHHRLRQNRGLRALNGFRKRIRG